MTEHTKKDTTKLIVIFDGSCDLCTASAEFLRLLDWRHRLECLPFQQPGLPQSYGLTIAECEQSVWVIQPVGRKLRGAQAISTALDTFVVLPIFTGIYKIPGIQQLEESVYKWVAKNRRYFPGITPYCKRPDANCGKY